MIIGSILDILALAEKYLQHPPQYCLFHVHVLPSLFQSVRRKEYVQKRAPASPSQTTVGQTAEVEVTQPDTTTGASSSVDSGHVLFQTCSGRRGSVRSHSLPPMDTIHGRRYGSLFSAAAQVSLEL